MENAPTQLDAVVETADRLDRFLARNFTFISRARFQRLIAGGQVQVDGKPQTDGGVKLKPGQTIMVCLPPPVAAEPLAENIELDVVFVRKQLGSRADPNDISPLRAGNRRGGRDRGSSRATHGLRARKPAVRGDGRAR